MMEIVDCSERKQDAVCTAGQDMSLKETVVKLTWNWSSVQAIVMFFNKVFFGQQAM